MSKFMLNAVCDSFGRAAVRYVLASGRLRFTIATRMNSTFTETMPGTPATGDSP